MQRPWGEWYVLEHGRNFKVKRLVIYPGQSISHQYHNHRDEHWIITTGEAEVLLDGETFTVEQGEHFVVRVGQKHKVTCVSNNAVVAIEVQQGLICEENDIVRLEEPDNEQTT